MARQETTSEVHIIHLNLIFIVTRCPTKQCTISPSFVHTPCEADLKVVIKYTVLHKLIIKSLMIYNVLNIIRVTNVRRDQPRGLVVRVSDY